MPKPPEPPEPIPTRLPDGTPAVVRPITPDDAALLVAGFEHLSDESRHRRFLEAIKHLTPQQVHYLTHADGYRHIAWGVTVESPETGEPIGVAVARCVRDPNAPETAEFAIAVADEWQHKGIGSMLARVVAERALRAGIRRFSGYMWADNRGAIALMDRLGELEERHYEAPGVLEATWRLRPGPEPAHRGG
ncbi:MAG: N-acetyltransferase family protein [Myxococcota bacterium]